MAVSQPAKRGDLVAIVETHTSTAVNGGTNEVRTEVQLGEVKSVNAEGEVRRAVVPYGESTLLFQAYTGATRRLLIVPQDRIDVQAALQTYREHTWPGHPGQTKPYESVAECKEAIRQHLRRP